MVFENRIRGFEQEICAILAQLAVHIHPKVVQRIQERNNEEAEYFSALFNDHINVSHYLFDGSACVFPGVRRYVSGKGKRKAYDFDYQAIIDDNSFPRHLWCFLVNGRCYSGPNWKICRLSDFELAHVFTHKESEVKTERTFFNNVQPNLRPYGEFTCACNVVLLPKGTVRPTDNSPTIKAAFYKRYIDLYGEKPLRGRTGLDMTKIPTWYDQLVWNKPPLPDDWKQNVERLLAYRKKRIGAILRRGIEDKFD